MAVSVWWVVSVVAIAGLGEASECQVYTGAVNTADCATGQQIDSFYSLKACDGPTNETQCITTMSVGSDGTSVTTITKTSVQCVNATAVQRTRTDCVNSSDCSNCNGPSVTWVEPVEVSPDGRCYPVSVIINGSNAGNSSWFTIAHGGNASAMFSSMWMNVNCVPVTPPSHGLSNHSKRGWIIVVAGVSGGVFVVLLITLFIIRARKRSSRGEGYGFLQDGY